MANTFYKPKNEYGELLISEKDAITIINNTAGDINNRIDSEVDELNGIISDTEKSLEEKINEADLLLNEKINDTNERLDEKIDTVEKQVTEHIIEVDEKHSLIIEEVLASEGVDPHEHFRLTIESDWETAINEGTLKEFAWRLAKTIFLVKNAPIKCECVTTCSCDDTYEEFICINSTKITEGEKPRFTRLGAVDSILATSKLPGSSVLVSDIYHTLDWDDFANNDKPVAGLSVAPIALRDFVHADTAISARLDARSEEIQKDIDAINDNLDHIRTELDGTIAEDGISGSRIDIIERVIGINGCCDNKEECSNKNHNATCEYCEPDCNIFCKINDINIRLDDNDRNDQELGAALEETNNNLDELSESIDVRFAETHNTITALDEKHVQQVEEIYSTINTKVEEINTSIDATNESLDSAHSRIDSLKKEHDTLVEANRNEHNEIIGIIGANKAEVTAKFYELDKIDGRHDSELGRLEDKVDREISDRIALSGQYSDLNNRVNDLYSDTTVIRSDINAHEITSSANFKKIEDSLAKDSENLEFFKVQNTAEHVQFSTKIENSEKKLSTIETLLNSHIEKTTGDIDAINKNVANNKDNIASIDSSLSEVSDDLDSLSERVSAVVEDLEKNIDLANENAKDITSIESRLNIAESSLTQEIATRANEDTNIKAILTQEIANNKEYTDNKLSEQYNKVSSEIQTGLSTKVDLTTYDSDIVTINERLDILSAEDVAIRSEISNNKTETDKAIEVINEKVTVHQENINKLIAKTDLHESDISSAKNNITLNAINISNLNSEVEKNRDDISDLQSTVTANSNRISTAEGTVTQLETKVDLLVVDNNTNKENISAINNDISEINSDLAEIKNLVDTSEGNINIFGTATIKAGKVSIPTEKILNRISAGEEKFWTITVNSVQEETSSGYQVIYPDIIYSSNTIEIVFGDENSADLNVLIAFTGINTTTNDIITL